MDGTRTHFIRTVKPNPEKTPLAMDIMYSLTQLKFSGVFEAVGIKKKGYPFRETFQNFYREYWSLCPPKAADGFDVGPVQSDPSKFVRLELRRLHTLALQDAHLSLLNARLLLPCADTRRQFPCCLPALALPVCTMERHASFTRQNSTARWKVSFM